jgi:glycosyltransferase involved in cell wall biosynthesis
MTHAPTIDDMPKSVVAGARESSEPVLSVVVCTFNRIRFLPECLDGLMRQTIQDQIEVIVVDDGSAEDTLSVVARYNVAFVALATNQGLSAARNAGIAVARAPIVAFTDDDVIVPDDWCESLLDAWETAPEGTYAIGGTVAVAEVTSLTQRYLARHNPLSPVELDVAHASNFRERLRAYMKRESIPSQSIRPVYSLVGANMSFLQEGLTATGGFDPTIRFGGDEELVCVNLRERFGEQSILCYPNIVVAHRFDPRLQDTLRRAFMYGFSSGRNWVRSGGLPSLRPVGGLSVVSFIVAAPVSVAGAALLSLIIPFVMWRRWIRAALTEREPEVLVYPLLALAQEVSSNVGLVVGWQDERWKRRSADRSARSG